LRRIVTTSDPNTWTQLTAEWWLAAYLYRQQMIIEAKPSTSAMGCGCSWVLTTSERTRLKTCSRGSMHGVVGNKEFRTPKYGVVAG
jgi:hypothetical protein